MRLLFGLISLGLVGCVAVPIQEPSIATIILTADAKPSESRLLACLDNFLSRYDYQVVRPKGAEDSVLFTLDARYDKLLGIGGCSHYTDRPDIEVRQSVGEVSLVFEGWDDPASTRNPVVIELRSLLVQEFGDAAIRTMFAPSRWRIITPGDS